jgi:hypothetical protein
MKSPMPSPIPAPGSRPPATAAPRSRFWLYAPYVLVLAVVLGWAGFWFMVKGRVAAGFDQWIAKEGEAGRDWACERRSIAGFPFRIEVKCAGVTLSRRNDPSAPALALGPVLVVAQIYDPRLVIGESAGPLTAIWADGRKGEMSWAGARMSLRSSSGGFERASLLFDKPVFASTGLDMEPVRAARSEMHLRPSPARAAEQAFELSLDVTALSFAGLDQLSGTREPADVKLSATATHAGAFMGGFTPATLDVWRAAGGAVEFSNFGIVKSQAVLEGAGWLGLDDYRRLKGRIDASQSGIDQIGGMRLGGLLDAGALFAGRPAVTTQGGRNLKPLPPIEARDGRVFIGPLRLPGTPLKPLF